MISQRCLISKIVYPCSCAKARNENNEKLACPIHEFGKGYRTFYPMNGIPKFHKWKPLRKGLTPLWPTEGFKKNIQRWKKYVWKFCYFPIFRILMLRAVFPLSWCWRWNFKLITIKLTTNQALSIDSSAKEREFLGLVIIFSCFSFS